MKTKFSTLNKLLVLFLAVAGLYYAKSFLIPLAIGTILAMLFLPLCRILEKKMSKGLAAVICLLILLLVMAGISALLGWQIMELTNNIEKIKLRTIEIIEYVQQYIYNNTGVSIESQSKILSDQQPVFARMIKGAAGSTASLSINLILILAYVVLFLYYRDHIKQFLIRLFPVSQRDEMEKVVSSVTRVSQQYLLGLSKMIICLWIMYGIGFSIIGIENAIFFAILCGLLEIVPFIGNLTGTTITILVSAVQGESTPTLIAIAATYGLVQFIQGWVLEPVILGPQVKINPLFTIIALIVGELIWGIPGVFLAIPLIAMFKIVCDHIEVLKPYGFLIGEVEKVRK